MPAAFALHIAFAGIDNTISLVLTQRYNIPEQQYRDPGEHW